MRSTLARAVLVAAAMMTVTVPVVSAAPPASKPAPAFSLQLFNGNTLRLADLKGTAVLLLFWAPW